MGTALAAHKQCLNSPSLNPENVLPQWQQKIANAENNEGRCRDQALDPFIFRTKCDFLQVLDLHIFLQKQPGHWGIVYVRLRPTP